MPVSIFKTVKLSCKEINISREMFAIVNTINPYNSWTSWKHVTKSCLSVLCSVKAACNFLFYHWLHVADRTIDCNRKFCISSIWSSLVHRVFRVSFHRVCTFQSPSQILVVFIDQIGAYNCKTYIVFFIFPQSIVCPSVTEFEFHNTFQTTSQNQFSTDIETNEKVIQDKTSAFLSP